MEDDKLERLSIINDNLANALKESNLLSQEYFDNDQDEKREPNLTAMKNLKDFCERHSLSYEDIEKEWFEFT